MTICIAVKVNDALVFATDSASTVTVGSEQIVYQNAHKTFNLHYELPLASMICGLGNIGPKSISPISKDLRRLFSEPNARFTLDVSNYSIEEVTLKAREYLFEDLFQAAAPDMDDPNAIYLKYFVGGYASNSDNAELWSFEIARGQCAPPRIEIARESASVAWGGQYEAVHRLLMGYATSFNNIMVGYGMSPPDATALLAAITPQVITPLVLPPMPTQDAIDLASFLAETARGYQRFMVGHNTIGGEIDVAAITRHEGFKWVRRKHFFPTNLNPQR